MMNYVRSEWYRVTHGKEIYLMTAVIAAGTVLMNLILMISDKLIPDFRYGTVRFSLNCFIGGLFFVCAVGLYVVGMLYSEEASRGTLKNAISYGFSRKSIFIGKCLVSVGISLCSMAVILIIYIGSACLLLKGPYLESVTKMMGGVGAVLLTAVASEILAVYLCMVSEKAMTVVARWCVIMVLIPQACFIMGMKFEWIRKIGDWMPWNFLNKEVIANMSGYQCLWESPEGLARCLIAGGAGIVIFLIGGLVFGNKKEV